MMWDKIIPNPNNKIFNIKEENRALILERVVERDDNNALFPVISLVSVVCIVCDLS
jgi:hypothetical protein